MYHVQQHVWKTFNEIVIFINSRGIPPGLIPNPISTIGHFIHKIALKIEPKWVDWGHYRTIRGFSSQLSSCLKYAGSSILITVLYFLATIFPHQSIDPGPWSGNNWSGPWPRSCVEDFLLGRFFCTVLGPGFHGPFCCRNFLSRLGSEFLTWIWSEFNVKLVSQWRKWYFQKIIL